MRKAALMMAATAAVAMTGQKVISIESLEVTKNYVISARLDEISQLQNGWFEGSGMAPNPDSLSRFSEKLIADYPEKLSIPLIISKQDGNILFEWKAEGDPSLDIDLTNLAASYHAFGANDEDVERDFQLDAAGWQSLFAFLNENIKVQQA